MNYPSLLLCGEEGASCFILPTNVRISIRSKDTCAGVLKYMWNWIGTNAAINIVQKVGQGMSELTHVEMFVGTSAKQDASVL